MPRWLLDRRAKFTHHAGILNGDNALIGEHPRQLHGLFIKWAQLLAVDRERADQAFARQHRNGRK